MATDAKKQPGNKVLYRSHMRRHFGDRLARPLDAISHRDVAVRFHFITRKNGGAVSRSCPSDS